jgi:hypothetical protein
MNDDPAEALENALGRDAYAQQAWREWFCGGRDRHSRESIPGESKAARQLLIEVAREHGPALLAERACLLAIKDAAQDVRTSRAELLATDRKAGETAWFGRFEDFLQACIRLDAALSALPEDQTP